MLDTPGGGAIVPAMCRDKKKSAALLLLTMLLATCGLTTGEQERAILDYYTDANREKYADLLVEIDRYTTSGAEYHKKYYKHLIGVAGDIVEKKKLSLEKGSVGFYYDKRSGDRSKLYLGLDINTRSSFEQSFETVSVSLIRGNLADVVQTINSCRSIFGEKDVMGTVIGWMWSSGGRPEHLSVWMVKEDVIKFEDRMITFDEFVHRSTVTDTKGRVIRLPL